MAVENPGFQDIQMEGLSGNSDLHNEPATKIKVESMWKNGIKPDFWITILCKGDENMGEEAYEVLQNALKQIMSRNHVQLVIQGWSTELIRMIKEIREDLDNYQRFVWLNECIVVGQSEKDDKHREISSLSLPSESTNNAFELMLLNQDIRKVYSEEDGVFFLDIVLCDDCETIQSIFELFCKISDENLIKPILLLKTGNSKADMFARVFEEISSPASAFQFNEELFIQMKDLRKKNTGSIFVAHVQDLGTNLYKEMLRMIFEGIHALERADGDNIHKLILLGIECGVEKVTRYARKYQNATTYAMDKYLVAQDPTSVRRLLQEKYNFNLDLYVKKRGLDLFNIKKNFNHDSTQNESKVLQYNFNPERIQLIILKLSKGNIEGEYILANLKTFSKPNQESGIDALLNSQQLMILSRTIVNQPDIAKEFWRKDKNHPLSNALLIRTLQKGIVDSGIYEDDVPGQLTDSITFFEEKCLNLLDTFYETNKEKTKELLELNQPIWMNQSLVTIAGDTDFKAFIAHKATQYVIHSQWNTKGSTDGQRKRWYPLSPLTKFYIHILMHFMSFLLMVFYVIEKKSNIHNYVQWVIFAMIISLLVDELRQALGERKTKYACMKSYIAQFWNKVDIVTLITFFIGFALHFYYELAADIILSLFAMLWCLKIGQFLRVSRTFGPYIIMIIRMLVRSKYFLAASFIIVLGYGVFLTSLLYPVASLVNAEVYLRVLFRPVLIFFGELGLQRYELDKSKTVFDTPKVHVAAEVVSIVGMIGFLLLTNCLLLNVLIADFNNIYEEVNAQAKLICAYEEYELLTEFQSKPFLPFPFSLIENAILIYKRCRNSKNAQDTEKNHHNRAEQQQAKEELERFQRCCMNMMLNKEGKANFGEINTSKNDILDAKMKRLMETVEEIKSAKLMTRVHDQDTQTEHIGHVTDESTIDDEFIYLGHI